MSQIVYLAGPITGLSYVGASDWRDFASCVLGDYGITALSPLRGKHYLSELTTIGKAHFRPDRPLSTPQGIVTRDHFDVSRCDLVLMNLIGATKVSIGTMFEAAWCHAYRKPLVVIIEPEGNVHDHAFIRQAAGFVVPTLTEGLEIVPAILAA